MRQLEALLRSYAVTHGPGPVRLPQHPAWHQLVHAANGVVRLDTPTGSWTLPPHRALWVRAGVEHTARVTRRAAVRSLYLPGDRPLLDTEIAVVEVTRLAAAMIDHLARAAPVPLDETGSAWVTVLADLARTLDVAPVELPALHDGPAATVAQLLREDPGADVALDVLARRAGASRRTVERGFRDQAAMSAGEWRRRLRLLRAVELLADGAPVGRVAVEVGYATQSAFGAAFKEHFGVPPASYFSSRSAEPTSVP